MTRAYTLSEIEAMEPCQEGIDWLKAHWPKGRKTWTLPEALRAGCDLGHAAWLASKDLATLPLVQTWAVDCAERVLPVFEAAYPNDDRPRKAIEAARRLIAEPTEENRAAARAAAARAAWAAAWAAARASPDFEAERDWQRARLAELLEGV